MFGGRFDRCFAGPLDASHLCARQTLNRLVFPAGSMGQGGIMSSAVALSRPELASGFRVLAGRILPEIESQLAERDASDACSCVHRSMKRRHQAFRRMGTLCDHGIAPAMQEDFSARFERAMSQQARRSALSGRRTPSVNP